MNDIPKSALDESSAGLSDAFLIYSGGRLFLGAVKDDERLVIADEECGSFADFRSLYFSNPLFSLPFRSIAVSEDHGSGYDLVPTPFLEDEQSIDLWMKGSLNGQKAVKELLPDQDCGVVFSVNEDFSEFVSRSFSRPVLCHPVTGLCLAALQFSRKNDEDGLFAMVSCLPSEPVLDVAHAEKGRLIFANRFRLHGETDALYYLTAVWRSEGLDQEKSILRLYGDCLGTSFVDVLGPLKNAVHSFEINDYKELGQEKPGASLFPASLRLRMLCG